MSDFKHPSERNIYYISDYRIKASGVERKRSPTLSSLMVFMIILSIIINISSLFFSTDEPTDLFLPYDTTARFEENSDIFVVRSHIKPQRIVNHVIAHLYVYDNSNECIYSGKQYVGFLYKNKEKELVFEIDAKDIKGKPEACRIEIGYQKLL